MMSIPIKQGGHSSPIITMKHARPRASPTAGSSAGSSLQSEVVSRECRVRPPRNVLRVLPPHRESHAGYRSASVDKAEDWDALESELAGDGWTYHTPNRGHLGLR